MKYLYFILSLLFLLGFLLLFNHLPLYLDKGLLREYSNIKELQDSLKIQKLPIPAYLPEIISWPPSKILGQSTPYLAVTLEFKSNINNDLILLLYISEKNNNRYSSNSMIINTKNTFSTTIKNRPALIKTGFCEKNVNCSEIIISDQQYNILLKGKIQLPILLRIAESINLE